MWEFVCLHRRSSRKRAPPAGAPRPGRLRKEPRSGCAEAAGAGLRRGGAFWVNAERLRFLLFLLHEDASEEEQKGAFVSHFENQLGGPARARSRGAAGDRLLSTF